MNTKDEEDAYREIVRDEQKTQDERFYAYKQLVSDEQQAQDERLVALENEITNNLKGYATEQWVLDKNYITIADVPNVNFDGYATEQWVLDQNYITTADLDLSEYATKIELTAEENARINADADLQRQISNLDHALTYCGSVDATSIDPPTCSMSVAHQYINSMNQSIHQCVNL